MKPNDRILETILLLMGGIGLILIFKFIQFEKLPYEIQKLYNGFWEYGRFGGILGNITFVAMVGLIVILWRKSTEEKLMKLGYEKEVKKLRNVFEEGVLSRYEFEEKLNGLYQKHQQNKAIEVNENLNSETKANTEKLLRDLTELKKEGLINEFEYNLKVAGINSNEVELPDQEAIDKIVSQIAFEANHEKYLSMEFTPTIQNRSNRELVEMIVNWHKYDKSALFQAIKEIEKRNRKKKSLSLNL
jgi:hypothetical protein